MAGEDRLDIALFIKKSFMGALVGAVAGAICLAIILGIKGAFDHRDWEAADWAISGVYEGLVLGSVAGTFVGLISGMIFALRRKIISFR